MAGAEGPLLVACCCSPQHRGSVFVSHYCVLGASPRASTCPGAGAEEISWLVMMGKWVCGGCWQDLGFPLQKGLSLRRSCESLFTQRKVLSSSSHQSLPGDTSLLCSGS